MKPRPRVARPAKSRAGDSLNPNETEEESIRRIREEKRKFNDGRTLNFPLDGSFIAVEYEPIPKTPRVKADRKVWYQSTLVKPKDTQNRIVKFSTNLPDGSVEVSDLARFLRDVTEALRTDGAVPKDWLAAGLSRFAEQYELVHDFRNHPLHDKPKPDWDARKLFNLPVKSRGRPENPDWCELFLALDVEFGCALGMDVNMAIDSTRHAWFPGDDGSKFEHGLEVTKDARDRWGKEAEEIVRILVKQDQDAAEKIDVADSVADHWDGLSRWLPRSPGYLASVKRRYTFKSI